MSLQRLPSEDFSVQVARAISTAKRSQHEKHSGGEHMGRYIVALDMIRCIAKPNMKIVDLASFGTMVPALRNVLGFQDLTLTGMPLAGRDPKDRLDIAMPDGSSLTCPFDRFDIEEQFPYEDGRFDLVIMTEVLEHISRDPMHTISEVNRITSDGGYLLLSTPNCISLRSFVRVMRGNHPFLWSQYSMLGHRDRHNREYTPEEIRSLLEAAGYEIVNLMTRDGAYGPSGRPLIRWAANAALSAVTFATGRFIPPSMRGESTFALARKRGPITNRFPECVESFNNQCHPPDMAPRGCSGGSSGEAAKDGKTLLKQSCHGKEAWLRNASQVCESLRVRRLFRSRRPLDICRNGCKFHELASCVLPSHPCAVNPIVHAPGLPARLKEIVRLAHFAFGALLPAPRWLPNSVRLAQFHFQPAAFTTPPRLRPHPVRLDSTKLSQNTDSATRPSASFAHQTLLHFP
jgi:SAM-dependent methyltransferase